MDFIIICYVSQLCVIQDVCRVIQNWKVEIDPVNGMKFSDSIFTYPLDFLLQLFAIQDV